LVLVLVTLAVVRKSLSKQPRPASQHLYVKTNTIVMDSTLKIAAGTGIIVVIGSLGVAAYMVFLQKKAVQRLQTAIVPIKKLEGAMRSVPFPNLSGAPTCVSAGKKAKLTSYTLSRSRQATLNVEDLTGTTLPKHLVGATMTCAFDAKSSTPGWTLTAVLPQLYGDTNPQIAQKYRVELDAEYQTLDSDCALKIATPTTHPGQLVVNPATDETEFVGCLPQALTRVSSIYTKGGIFVSKKFNTKCKTCA
jgi:hypothetical protein